MQRDYTFECLNTMPRDELEEFSQKMIHRLVPPEMVREIFSFEPEEMESEERRQAAHFDALLRMHAVALGEIPLLFEESEHKEQNVHRMYRLVLWHFYALAFHLERAIPLSAHCDEVESIIAQAPADAL